MYVIEAECRALIGRGAQADVVCRPSTGLVLSRGLPVTSPWSVASFLSRSGRSELGALKDGFEEVSLGFGAEGFGAEEAEERTERRSFAFSRHDGSS